MRGYKTYSERIEYFLNTLDQEHTEEEDFKKIKLSFFVKLIYVFYSIKDILSLNNHILLNLKNAIKIDFYKKFNLFLYY